MICSCNVSVPFFWTSSSLTPYPTPARKTQQWPQVWKRTVFIPIPPKKKGRQCKECSNYHTTALISHTSKVMLKIHQARLQQYMNHELPDFQAGFRKGRGIRIQIANIEVSASASVLPMNIQDWFPLGLTGWISTGWFQIGKGCILSPCLIILYAEYILQNARLDEAQVRIKMPGEISITSDTKMTPPLWQKAKKN